MEIINARIKGILNINDIEYFEIIDTDKKKYCVPKDQIDQFEGVRLHKTYDFIKKKLKGKINLTIINPKYQLNSIVEMDVEQTFKENNQEYFELKSNYESLLTVLKLPGQDDLKKLKCKVIDYNQNKPVLINIDTKNYDWDYNYTYEFHILGYENIHKRKEDFIKINFKDRNLYVEPKKWQKQELWNYKTIFCKVIGLTKDGYPKLISYDHRHPYMKIGESYNLEISDFKSKIINSNNKIEIIELTDKYELSYEVIALPNQNKRLKKGQEIECVVRDINTKIYLSQKDPDDPFYFRFEDIISDKTIKKKYFDSILEKKEEFPEFISQYESKRGFWVFTYCNHIIPALKNNYTKRKKHFEITELINLHSKIEEWILNNGILKAIQDDSERKLNKLKAKSIISQNNKELYVLNLILELKNSKDIFKDNFNLEELYHYLKYQDFESIDVFFLIEKLENENQLNKDELYISKKILNLVRRLLHIYFDDYTNMYFVFTSNNKVVKYKEINKYLNWLFFCVKLSSFVKLNQLKNFYLSIFLRISAFKESDKDVKRKFLYNSFNILKNINSTFDFPIYTTIEKTHKIYADDLYYASENMVLQEINYENQLVEVIERYYNGFKVRFNKTIGFLPLQNITDVNLKNSQILNLKWKISVKLTVYSETFNYFLCKQLDKSDENYFSEKFASTRILKEGNIVFGRVKNITEFHSKFFGIFVSTQYGEGMIHEKNIPDEYRNSIRSNIENLINKEMPLYFLNYKQDNLNFSLKELGNTKYDEEILQIVDNIDENKKSFNFIDLDYNIELEKGNIFEQYAVISDDLNEKINYIKFAKASFSNTNNSRSYLLNIYLDYFESLNYLDDIIESNGIENYDNFKKYIIQIKERIDDKTLQEFPESKNLIFFINVLYLFNSEKNEDLVELFHKIESIQNSNEISLLAVAKIVLANNLLISELDNNQTINKNNFIIKNLNRIRKYIDNGVLSVEETKKDIINKDRLEKIEYWKSKIEEDEGESLEFKATFKTPVPNAEKKRILSHLEKELKKTSDIVKKSKIEGKITELKSDQQIEKKLIHSALKNICAFANTNGGYLLLGVSDDKKIYGLEQDFDSFQKDNEKNRDGFGKFLDSKINEYFGESFSSSFLQKEFIEFNEGDVLLIKVLKSSKVVHILKNEKGKKEECVYIRNLSSSNKLEGIELYKFIENKLKT